MVLTTFLWHELQSDLLENSSAADCENAWQQERLSHMVATFHAMCGNGGKNMLLTISSTVAVLHCNTTCANKCGYTQPLSQST